MTDLKKLVQFYLEKERVMQLATSTDNQPWVCTVHFYVDKNSNFYWISNPTSRHSKDIEANENVAVTIKIHEDTPEEQYVVGISVEGRAKIVDKKDKEKIIKLYESKFGLSKKTQRALLDNTFTEKIYQLKPSSIVLFDTKTFPNDPRQIYKINSS